MLSAPRTLRMLVLEAPAGERPLGMRTFVTGLGAQGLHAVSRRAKIGARTTIRSEQFETALGVYPCKN
jgi:hypothetical protein